MARTHAARLFGNFHGKSDVLLFGMRTYLFGTVKAHKARDTGHFNDYEVGANGVVLLIVLCVREGWVFVRFCGQSVCSPSEPFWEGVKNWNVPRVLMAKEVCSASTPPEAAMVTEVAAQCAVYGDERLWAGENPRRPCLGTALRKNRPLVDSVRLNVLQ